MLFLSKNVLVFYVTIYISLLKSVSLLCSFLKKGYSQLKLALEIGLDGAAYLGRMEIRTKNHRFNLEHLAKISKVLEVDICEFFK